MEGMEYFYELYKALPRGGPGDNISTRRAYDAMDTVPEKPNILDIGCGPGMQTLELARLSKGNIIALDNYQPFLDILMKNAKKEELEEYIEPKNQSMLDMDFKQSTFDIIWSEGALYFFGFRKGLKWLNFILKDKAYLVFSEAVYLLSDPPEQVIEYWENEYPEIGTIDDNIALIEEEGYKLLDHFTLPKSTWFDHFYTPMEEQIQQLKKKHANNQTALRVLNYAQKDITTYKEYSDYFGYEFFITQKI